MVQKPILKESVGFAGLDTAAIIEIVSVFSWVTNTQTNPQSVEGFGLYINPTVTHRGKTRLPATTQRLRRKQQNCERFGDSKELDHNNTKISENKLELHTVCCAIYTPTYLYSITLTE